jgi:hypothetical protein
MYGTSLFSGKAVIMSSGSPSTEFYESSKKSWRDVDAGEGDQEILHLKEHPRGQCLGTSQEVACTLIR